MRIRFLTATVEPGKDGIGDYTLRLAAECEKRGHTTEIVAFNDRYAGEIVAEAALLRLPRTLAWARRANEFEAWTRGRPAPDWISFQFAPYALHPKGMVMGWAKRIGPLTAARKLQMMFHEIWIGEERSAPVFHRCIGALQRQFIQAMVRSLHPRAIHTSNAFYEGALRRRGFSAGILPLFGNIPFRSDPSPEETKRDLGERLGIEDPSKRWSFAIFGTLHPVWPAEPLMSHLIAAARRNEKTVCLISVGRIGAGKGLWEKMRRDYAESVRFLEMGELPADEISRLLQAVDFGIATTPYEILGKSGTVAALREHGLPVIVNRFEREPDPGRMPKGLYTPETFAAAAPDIHRPPLLKAATVVEQFLAELGVVS